MLVYQDKIPLETAGFKGGFSLTPWNWAIRTESLHLRS